MDRCRTTAVLVALVAAAAPACAQTVQKCVSGDGQVRYQSAPCEPHERTAGTWDAVPDARPDTRSAARTEGSQRSPISATRTARRGARAPTSPPPRDACAEARQARDEGERRAGLKRTYALLSSLQARVFEACR